MTLYIRSMIQLHQKMY